MCNKCELINYYNKYCQIFFQFGDRYLLWSLIILNLYCISIKEVTSESNSILMYNYF